MVSYQIVEGLVELLCDGGEVGVELLVVAGLQGLCGLVEG